jgi:hypothetical protein
MTKRLRFLQIIEACLDSILLLPRARRRPMEPDSAQEAPAAGQRYRAHWTFAAH